MQLFRLASRGLCTYPRDIAGGIGPKSKKYGPVVEGRRHGPAIAEIAMNRALLGNNRITSVYSAFIPPSGFTDFLKIRCAFFTLVQPINQLITWAVL